MFTNGRLQVRVAESSGNPLVQVPAHAVWDLVEFLSCTRTPVRYSYQFECFTVEFLRLDAPAAQTILDDWHAFASAEASAVH